MSLAERGRLPNERGSNEKHRERFYEGRSLLMWPFKKTPCSVQKEGFHQLEWSALGLRPPVGG